MYWSVTNGYGKILLQLCATVRDPFLPVIPVGKNLRLISYVLYDDVPGKAPRDAVFPTMASTPSLPEPTRPGTPHTPLGSSSLWRACQEIKKNI